MYRVKQKKDNKWIIQRKVLGVWFNIKKPAWFSSSGGAQSYINTVLEK